MQGLLIQRGTLLFSFMYLSCIIIIESEVCYFSFNGKSKLLNAQAALV